MRRDAMRCDANANGDGDGKRREQGMGKVGGT